MADLSALGELKSLDPMDLTTYVDSKASTFQLPKAGTYTLMAADSFPPAAWSRTKAGSLSATIDPTIVGPTNEGFQLRFTKVSAKEFKRSGESVSQAGDYLRACGITGKVTNEQELADLIESTAGTVFEAVLDWRVYNKNSGFSLEGMTRFPKNDDGTYQSWVADPTAKDENGLPQRVRANVNIVRFIPRA